MNVLSLFDGMSCGQIAFERAGIKVDNYFASELDKHAIKVTMANYPDTIQLGDVAKVSCGDLPNIDFLIGGSPCQGFSFAGKQLAFNDQRSSLLFEYVRILGEIREINPQVKFILENVRMKKEHLEVITNLLGVDPVCINSALVSAQNRVRYYWTNIKGVVQPGDHGRDLDGVLEGGAVDRMKSYCIDANYSKGGSLKQYFEKKRRQLVFLDDERTLSFLRKEYGTLSYKKAVGQLRVVDGKSNTSTTSGQNFSNSGSTNLMYKHGNSVGFRALTPIECERLQTVPCDYTNHVSKTQRYKMLGNGFTVDVIAHILSFYNHSYNGG